MSAWCALNSVRCLETFRPRLLAQNPDLSASSQAMAAAVPITFHRPIAAWFVATQLGAQATPSAGGRGRGPALLERALQGPELVDVEAATPSLVRGPPAGEELQAQYRLGVVEGTAESWYVA